MLALLGRARPAFPNGGDLSGRRGSGSEQPGRAVPLADFYRPSGRPHYGLPEFSHPLHDKHCMVTACGGVRMHRKKSNISTALAGRPVDLKEVEGGIRSVSFMHCDLGTLALEQKTLHPLDDPFGPGLLPTS